ncbi:hypothetical protein [Micromonospora sp. NPDC001898]|uniref:hypothetical protein n=1 Tax=Micromonospora sp. NPDC001898 TaxID=3364221 RepID=UPI0036C15960
MTGVRREGGARDAPPTCPPAVPAAAGRVLAPAPLARAPLPRVPLARAPLPRVPLARAPLPRVPLARAPLARGLVVAGVAGVAG